MATYGMKDACNLTLVKRGTNEVVLHSDYANTTNVEWKSDRVFAKKKGANAIAWDAARTGELTVETELFDLRLMALIAGDTELHKGSDGVFKNERFTLSSDHLIKTEKTPLPGTVSVFRLNSDGITHAEEIPQLVDGGANAVPAMPADVAVSAKDTSADISWGSVAGAESYTIFRDGIEIGHPASGVTTFKDTNLKPETQYTYKVVAINKNGVSPKSAEVVVTTAKSGTTEAGAAVKATAAAITAATSAAQNVNTNDLNFQLLDTGMIKLSDGAATGADYAVYYAAKVEGVSSFSVDANRFADNYEIYADTFIRDQQEGNDHFAQIHYTNAKPQGSFTFNQNSKEPTSLSIKFDLMPDENNKMAYYKFIED